MLVKIKENLNPFLRKDDLVYIEHQEESYQSPKCPCWCKWKEEGKIQEIEE